MKRIVVLSAVFFQSFLIYSQEPNDWAYQAKWQTRPGVGLNIPLTHLLSGAITDHLIDYTDETTYYTQAINGTWFFKKHWGVEFNYQGSFSVRLTGQKREEQFFQLLQREYGDQYFVNPSSGATYDNLNPISGSIERGLIGIVYRKEIGRWFVHPKVAIGVVSFYADWGSASLKEKNSNTSLRVNYAADRVPQDHFALATSLIAGYKLSKRIHWNIEAMASHYKTNLTFNKTVTNLPTGMSTITERFHYAQNIFTLSLGMGLIVVIR
jgi:hypothetical protein